MRGNEMKKTFPAVERVPEAKGLTYQTETLGRASTHEFDLEGGWERWAEGLVPRPSLGWWSVFPLERSTLTHWVAA